MSSEPGVLIEARGLGKRYELYESPMARLKGLLWGGGQGAQRSFWALQDVSFSVAKGEVVGLVGRNGAGKSTLLQLVCGTLAPTEGQLSVNGRIAALLELGAGFNPDFTGIENVYLNAALLGLTRAEVDERLDDVLAFADIGRFVHQPVKTYSSGMFVRLAFAVATAVDPEVLVVDEALSVGDGAFARKSFERVMTMRERGAAVLFCSHSMYHIQALCNRALWLEQGRVRMYDGASKVTSAYETALVAESADHLNSKVGRPHGQVDGSEIAGATMASGSVADGVMAEGTGRITSVHAWTDDGQNGLELALQSGETTLCVQVGFELDPALPDPSLAFGLAHLSGVTISSGISLGSGRVFGRDARGCGKGVLRLPRVPLLQGDFFLSVFLACDRGLHVYEVVERVVTLRVSQKGLEQGLVSLPVEWLTE